MAYSYMNLQLGCCCRMKSTVWLYFQSGRGYPKAEAVRKQRDTKPLKQIKQIVQKSLTGILPGLEPAARWDSFYAYLLQYGQDAHLKEILQMLC